jgi:hypothetical protein
VATLSMTDLPTTTAPADPAAVPPLPVIHEPRRPADPLKQEPIEVICGLTRSTHEAQMRLDAGNLGRVDNEEIEALTKLRDLLDVALNATPDQRQRMRDRVRGHIGETGRRLAALDRRRGQAERWAEGQAFATLRRLKRESEGWFDCPDGEI